MVFHPGRALPFFFPGCVGLLCGWYVFLIKWLVLVKLECQALE